MKPRLSAHLESACRHISESAQSKHRDEGRLKTTEFFAYLAVVVGLLIAGNTVEGHDGGADYFAAEKVWLCVTLLTIGYMVSRGLAKAGSRDSYDEQDDH